MGSTLVLWSIMAKVGHSLATLGPCTYSVQTYRCLIRHLIKSIINAGWNELSLKQSVLLAAYVAVMVPCMICRSLWCVYVSKKIPESMPSTGRSF